MRPIHHYIMEYEHLKISWALQLIKQAGVLPRQIKQLCTDSVLFQPANLRKKRCLEIADTKFRDLKRAKGVTPCAIQTTESEELVYRVEEKDKRLFGNYKLPIRENFPISINKREWRDVDPYEAIAIFGPPGCGKSWTASKLIEILRAQNKKVAVVSKTHTAAMNLGGCTCNHFCFKHILHGGFSGDFVILDEVSQLELGLWMQLSKLCYVGVKFILLGDFRQLSPIGGHVHAGEILADDCIENSDLLKIMADCNRCILTENKRSDEKLFSFYAPLPSRSEDLKTLLEEARKMFPRKRGWPDTSIVISHKMRQKLNERQNKATKPEDAVQVWANDGEIWLHKGLRLVGHMQEKKQGFVNNGSYRITELCGDGSAAAAPQGLAIKFECEISKKELSASLDFVKAHLRLCYAITAASVQGATIRGRLRVYTNSRWFSKTHLYVCCSRATSSALLEVI